MYAISFVFNCILVCVRKGLVKIVAHVHVLEVCISTTNQVAARVRDERKRVSTVVGWTYF